MDYILGHGVKGIAAAAIAEAFPPEGALEPGSTELRLGIEGNVGGWNFSSGLHGRLVVARKPRRYDELVERLVAQALACMPPARRAAAVKRLVADAANCDEEDLQYLRDARKILRALRKKTGVSFQPTPTHKPKV